MAAAEAQFTIRDRTNEYSSVSLYLPAVDETNWVETNTRLLAVQAAITAITTGRMARKRLVALNAEIDDTQPINPYAQRELGVRMFYQETAGEKKKFHITVPCPDLAIIDVSDGDYIDVENITVMNTLAQAIEAVAVSPNGHPIEFYRAKLVGRRN